MNISGISAGRDLSDCRVASARRMEKTVPADHSNAIGVSRTPVIPPDEGVSSERGLSLTEVTVIAFVVGILAVIGTQSVLNYIERARLVKCMAEIRGIQAAIIMDSDRQRRFQDPETFWKNHFHGKKPGPYYYLLDGDPNKGHGNDLDGIDEENPGKADRDRQDIKFVVLCQHNHKHLGSYVYCVDAEPPVVVGGPDGVEDPKYTRFIKYEFGGPGGGNDK